MVSFAALRAEMLKVAQQVRQINSNKELSAKEKAQRIGRLTGMTRSMMYNFVNKNYRTGPTLAKTLEPFVSVGRPRGAPEGSARGRKRRDD